ncbi:oxidoreductase, partial [Sphingopyxis flava]
ASTHPTGLPSLASLDDSIIDEYRKLMDAIRPTGMKVFQQLWHSGAIYPNPTGGPPWSASDMSSPIHPFTSQPMTRWQIDELVESFVAATRRCVEGGVDGVEIHLAHGYLLHQFLSPLTNRREDEYGGSLENRLRLPKRILSEVRAIVPNGYPVGVRISASEEPEGLGAEEIKQMIGIFEREKLIDFADCSLGDYYTSSSIIAPMDQPSGYQLPSSVDIASVATVPTIVIGRIRTLEEAEQIIRQGQADMVAMTRAHIADPDIVAKTRAGHPEQVRPCIACNQGCIGQVARGFPLGCAVNPAAGFEGVLADDLLAKTDTPMRLLVVGGGPAGMEAARVAALQGHKVTLVEASPQLGGLVNVARRAPRLHTLGDIATWLESEVYRLGVDVRTNTYFDADDVRGENPDAVVVATGSWPRGDGLQITNQAQPITGFDLPHVLTSLDLLTSNNENLGKHALVYDDVGHYEAIAAADYLLEKGLSVTYVTRFLAFAPQLDPATRTDAILTRLHARDFRVVIRHELRSIAAGKSVIGPIHHVARSEEIPADTVVFVSANRS